VRTFVDTSVVLHAYDQREPEKSAIAREILSDLSFWDALIIVAAARSGAERIVSEDLQHGRTFGGVRNREPVPSLTCSSWVPFPWARDQDFEHKLGAIDPWSWVKPFGATVVKGHQW
jgi:hypothetical protein